jgi:hypothetical protein
VGLDRERSSGGHMTEGLGKPPARPLCRLPNEILTPTGHRRCVQDPSRELLFDLTDAASRIVRVKRRSPAPRKHARGVDHSVEMESMHSIPAPTRLGAGFDRNAKEQS